MGRGGGGDGGDWEEGDICKTGIEGGGQGFGKLGRREGEEREVVWWRWWYKGIGSTVAAQGRVMLLGEGWRGGGYGSIGRV